MWLNPTGLTTDLDAEQSLEGGGWELWSEVLASHSNLRKTGKKADSVLGDESNWLHPRKTLET